MDIAIMVTYISPFIPKLAEHTKTLHELLKQDVEYIWAPAHITAFRKLKSLICKGITLAYFDPSKDTQIEVDASTRDLGAAFIQKGMPIAFASKSLSSAEERYANVERELLAVVFGCEHFHTYIYGYHFTIRMLLKLQNYDLQIVYKPGKEMLLPDGLSQLLSIANTHIDLDLQVSHIQFSTAKIEELVQETSKDPALSASREVIVTSWPDSRKELPASLRDYWSFRDQLSVENGILVKELAHLGLKHILRHDKTKGHYLVVVPTKRCIKSGKQGTTLVQHNRPIPILGV